MRGLVELDKSRYKDVREYALLSRGEAEYYIAITDGVQRGRVFVNDTNNIRSVLFWHYCGYGFAAGEMSEEFTAGVASMIKRQHTYFKCDKTLHKRFILQQENDALEDFLDADKEIKRSERLCFSLEGGFVNAFELPEGFEIKKIDSKLLGKIKGDVTPAFSWSSSEEFLRFGSGFCVTHKDEAAAWAFSSALGGGRVDIGVETAEKYRGMGLGKAAASKTASFYVAKGFMPVWGCDVSNEASAKTALAVGFSFNYKHAKYKKA